ncbi:beta-ketoacyl synthase N-terminal-like domain-containing protein [Gilvimarinus polysaccharolyticus]|uniref:beta-ketoacyl synthase N-terminal-like domain-containing protein n=1 Tax=Gilvimarinus polysaccharolyticus TaxID=863921 RepID=UPI0006738D98|nr:beta-ketoacyl synthase N-terminal-like domain-containing protein [Gilvimarinus polysaccharolyticus]
MPTYIRQLDAQCSLGENLASCVTALLAEQKSLSPQAFEQLHDPLQLPYFSSKQDPAAQDFYQRLNVFLENLLLACGLDGTARQRTALLIGSSSFDVHISEQRYREDLQQRGAAAMPMPIVGYGKLAARLASELGLSAHHHTYSTACTSSSNALLYGHRLLQAGLVDHALVLGSEQANHTSQLGFYGLGLISPGQSMQPFGAERDGLILGDSLAALLLSRGSNTPPHEQRWQLLGGAIGTDNHSLTAAHVDGQELSKTIRQALSDSNIEARDICAIKVHGTASLKNDEAEAAALLDVFAHQMPPAFALKPFCGHTLGASGALEVALSLGALQQGRLPANTHAINDGHLGVALIRQTQTAPSGNYLFNCFAFGGNNNALIIRDCGANA